MKNMKSIKLYAIISAIIYLIVFIAIAKAHSDCFSVLAVINRVEYKETDKWQLVYAGDELKTNGKVKLSKDSYLGLAFSNGYTIELKEQGEYSLAELSKSAKMPDSPLKNKIIDYLVKEINTSKDILRSQRKDNMEIKASVERAIKFDTKDTEKEIFLRSPRKADIIGDSVPIKWIMIPGVDEYTFHLNLLFKEIYKVNVKGSEFVLNRKELSDNINENEYYFWHITAGGDVPAKSVEACIRFIPADEADKIKRQLDEISSDIDLSSPLGKIVLAAFYERNNLIISAENAYKEAVLLEPSSVEFFLLYTKFLIRNGINTY